MKAAIEALEVRLQAMFRQLEDTTPPHLLETLARLEAATAAEEAREPA